MPAQLGHLVQPEKLHFKGRRRRKGAPTKTARHLAHFGETSVVGIIDEFEPELAVRRIG
jgi:hypothetical protein